MLAAVELDFLPEIDTSVIGGGEGGGRLRCGGWLGKNDDKNESGGGVESIFFLS